MEYQVTAYRDCKWCQGRGCNFCDTEREKANAHYQMPEPIFTARFDKPDEMAQLTSISHRTELDKVFGATDMHTAMDEIVSKCKEAMETRDE